jgi:DNA (cytosine-5)-methyltransferase 1
MEFGATYPYEGLSPWATPRSNLQTYRGSHGVPLRGRGEELFAQLPSYARTQERRFPHWKKLFIRQNREFYKAHKHWIDLWLPAILDFPPSLQKFEWNCKGEERDIWKYVIQFRASGVRVKRPSTAPSLVAMTTTQVPIIGWQKRYMTPRECARLQSMHDLKVLPSVATRAFKALGNAVNAELIRLIAANLVGSSQNCTSAPTSSDWDRDAASGIQKMPDHEEVVSYL